MIRLLYDELEMLKNILTSVSLHFMDVLIARNHKFPRDYCTQFCWAINIREILFKRLSERWKQKNSFRFYEHYTGYFLFVWWKQQKSYQEKREVRYLILIKSTWAGCINQIDIFPFNESFLYIASLLTLLSRYVSIFKVMVSSYRDSC